MSEVLDKDDQQRVNNCEYYLKTKQVMKNAEAYKDLQVGEVYFIKYSHKRDNKEKYVETGWNSGEPAKYMIFHKDEGFVFIKRIIASGSLGKEVTCLTTTYDVGEYWLEPDPDYVNSILLEDEAGYDPLAASKAMTGKKNKARRRNKKMEITFDDAKEAYAYIKSLKVGDSLYDAETAYGNGMIVWKVDQIATSDVDNSEPPAWSRRHDSSLNMYKGLTTIDQMHNKFSFSKVIKIQLKATSLPESRRWISDKREITFDTFMGQKWEKYYKTKPFTVDDV